MDAMTVHVINPRKKTGRKKKATRRKKRGHKKTSAKRTTNRSNKSMAKKRATRRRSAPAKRGSSTTRRYTRRRKNPAPPKTRRRRNPSRGGIGAVTSEMKSAIPRLMGMMFTAWCVKRWSAYTGGGSGGLFSTAHTSPMLGESWSLPQYAVAGAAALWGPKLFGKWINATEFRRGAVDLVMQKLIWTEGFARSQWAQNQFGTGDVAMGPYQQAYVDQGGRWVAMQGLVEASPLDGLVEASSLDAAPDYSYGHLLPAGVSAETAKAGRYSGSGYTSNYHAAFTA